MLVKVRDGCSQSDDYGCYGWKAGDCGGLLPRNATSTSLSLSSSLSSRLTSVLKVRKRGEYYYVYATIVIVNLEMLL